MAMLHGAITFRIFLFIFIFSFVKIYSFLKYSFSLSYFLFISRIFDILLFWFFKNQRNYIFIMNLYTDIEKKEKTNGYNTIFSTKCYRPSYGRRSSICWECCQAILDIIYILDFRIHWNWKSFRVCLENFQNEAEYPDLFLYVDDSNLYLPYAFHKADYEGKASKQEPKV